MHALTIQVLHNGNPVRSKTVGCVHEGGGPLGLIGTNQSGRTDDEGMVHFNNVPNGITHIYIDGEEKDTVDYGPYDPDENRTINI